MKFENIAKIGDVIRAYDFMGSKEAYLEGTIIAKGEIKHPVNGMHLFDGFTIVVEKDAAEFGRENDEAYIPFETSLEYDGRVELIQEAV